MPSPGSPAVESELVLWVLDPRAGRLPFLGPPLQTVPPACAREGTKGSFDMSTWGASLSEKITGAAFCPSKRLKDALWALPLMRWVFMVFLRASSKKTQ